MGRPKVHKGLAFWMLDLRGQKTNSFIVSERVEMDFQGRGLGALQAQRRPNLETQRSIVKLMPESNSSPWGGEEGKK
jgi:hypothetical protein